MSRSKTPPKETVNKTSVPKAEKPENEEFHTNVAEQICRSIGNSFRIIASGVALPPNEKAELLASADLLDPQPKPIEEEDKEDA